MYWQQLQRHKWVPANSFYLYSSPAVYGRPWWSNFTRSKHSCSKTHRLIFILQLKKLRLGPEEMVRQLRVHPALAEDRISVVSTDIRWFTATHNSSFRACHTLTSEGTDTHMHITIPHMHKIQN